MFDHDLGPLTSAVLDVRMLLSVANDALDDLYAARLIGSRRLFRDLIKRIAHGDMFCSAALQDLDAVVQPLIALIDVEWREEFHVGEHCPEGGWSMWERTQRGAQLQEMAGPFLALHRAVHAAVHLIEAERAAAKIGSELFS